MAAADRPQHPRTKLCCNTTDRQRADGLGGLVAVVAARPRGSAHRYVPVASVGDQRGRRKSNAYKSFAFQAANTQRRIARLPTRGVLDVVDVGLRIAVGDFQSSRRGMF